MTGFPKRVYICGPMSGIPQFNIPAFDALAADLRKQVASPGVKAFDVVSPAELDGPKVRAELLQSKAGSPDDYPSDLTWGDFLARDVRLIADDGIEMIVVLPGWEESRGARLETFVGHLTGCKIVSFTYSYNRHHVSLWEVPLDRLVAAWRG